jgi:hypothetical protein
MELTHHKEPDVVVSVVSLIECDRGQEVLREVLESSAVCSDGPKAGTKANTPSKRLKVAPYPQLIEYGEIYDRGGDDGLGADTVNVVCVGLLLWSVVANARRGSTGAGTRHGNRTRVK